MYQKQNVSKTIDTSQIEENIVNSLEFFHFHFRNYFTLTKLMNTSLWLKAQKLNKNNGVVKETFIDIR
jgi:hypothetical protein